MNCLVFVGGGGVAENWWVTMALQKDKLLGLAGGWGDGTARVKEECFSLSFMAAPCCQTGPRASTGNFS